MRNLITNINESDKNYVFSPIAVYYALCLLAQTTAGETKREILDVLNVGEEELLSRANIIYDAFNEGDILSLNSSLWLNNAHRFNEDAIEQIGINNNSTIEIGYMGDKEFDDKLHDWLNKNTGGLLKDNVDSISFTGDTLMELFSAIYLKGSWTDHFNKNETSIKTFHVDDSNEVECEFMNRTFSDVVLIGEKFKVVKIHITGIGTMSFFLPNEGYAPNDICDDEELISYLEGRQDCLTRGMFNINLSLPKFDVKADGDLLTQLKKLGIRKAMDMYEADFSIISDEKDLCLAKANQASRIKIDENGIEAASYVEMAVLMKGIPFMAETEIDMIFDRPFMFVVERECMPLFVGTITNPNE